MRRSLILVATLLLSALPLFTYASTGLKIQPVKIDETLSPGQSTSGTINLTNVSDTPVEVQITLQDFVPLAGADSIQFVGRAPGVTSVRDWISIAGPAVFTFKVGETKDISYTIAAPANAEPGGHFGVVLFKATEANSANQLKVGTQVGMLVLVAVPGSHTEKGKIQSFTAPAFLQQAPVPFTMVFENTGTVHFEPRGQIIIKDMLGRTAGTVPISGVVTLPTSIKKMEFDWNVSGFLFGHYSAVATIIDGDGNTLTSSEVSFWVVPVWYTIAFFILLLVIFFILRFLKRRVKISVSMN